MKAPLPTAEQLERLPIRALVAYAARTARCASLQLRGIVADDILDTALRLVEAVSTTRLISEIDPVSVVCAGERVAASYANVTIAKKSAQRFRMVLSVVQATLTAMYAQLAIENTDGSRHQMARAAEAAQRTAHPIEYIRGKTGTAARKATREDYAILFRRYGEHRQVVIGEPVDCFEEED